MAPRTALPAAGRRYTEEMKQARLVKSLRRLLEDDARVVAAYLYGSRGRGDHHPDSDVDLGVLFAETPPPRLDSPVAELEARLEAALGLSVQVVAVNNAPPDLVHRVLRDGAIVHESDRARRIRFEVAARNRYFDLLPHLRRYRKAG